MSWISDSMVDRLRAAASWPELDERYTITGVAGQGGMGTVYVAHDLVLDRDVAVKVLDVADRSGARASRILREAHILGRLDHPGIVPVHDAGTLADGRTFYVMKLVRGRRMDEMLEHDGSNSRGVATAAATLSDRLALFSRVLDAVAFAHSLGVVHRDLKPENIMVGGFGEVYVMDWGVAVTASPSAVESLPDVVAGTPGFMAPEQEQTAAIDARADVFALGALLQHLLPPSPPRALSAIAQKASRADVNARYQSVAGIAADLARFRNHEPVEAYAESIAERLLRVYRRYELPVLLVVAYILMRAVLLIWGRV
jgi:serine/threonine protein kinase